MRREIGLNIRKIISLILTVAMVMGSNIVWNFEDAYADPDPGAGDPPAAPTMVTFTDDNFIQFLSVYYPDKFGEIYNVEADGTKGTNHGVVAESTIEEITSLNFTYDKEKESLFPESKFNAIDFTQLKYFKNLTELTISGNTSVNAISVSSSPAVDSDTNFSKLKKLKITNCNFPSKSPDILTARNLEELVFTNNTFANSGIAVINGLREITTLKKVIFDGSQIDSITLSGSADTGLEFSAVGCTKLGSLNFGGYKLINGYDSDGNQYAPSIKHCTSLDTVEIKGIADQSAQTLDISECYSLATVTLNYDFTSEDNKLTINADGILIPSSNGSLVVNRKYNGVDKTEVNTGKWNFNIIAFRDTYLCSCAKSYYESGNLLFDAPDEEYDPNKPAFIVFEQDKERFEKQQLWLDKNSTYRRSYDANPVNLRVGESIENNRVYLYTSRGTLIDSSKMTLTWSKTPSDGSVITQSDISGKNTITAVGPGDAELTVQVGESGSSATQKIIVYSPISSLSFGQSESEHLSEETKQVYEQTGAYPFYAKLTPTYGSLVNKAGDVIGAVEWKIEKKDGGSWVPLTSVTDGGLSIASKENSVVTDSVNSANNYINKESTLSIGYKMSGGEYRIYGVVQDNYVDPTHNNTTSGRQVIETKASDAKAYYYFEVIAASSDAGEIGYGYVPGDKDAKAKETTIAPPSSIGSDYTVTAAFSNDADKHYSDYLILEKVSGTNKHKLSFNTTKSDKEIATFLRSLGSDCSVTIVLTAQNASETKTYNKKIELSGYFTVSYDLNGGTLENDNTECYYIPTPSSKDMDLELNSPVLSGKNFDGWYIKGTNDKVTKLLEGAGIGNLELEARWTEDKKPSNDNSESNENSGSSNNDSNSNGGGSGSQAPAATQPATVNVVPTYTPKEKTPVFSTTIVNEKGESKEVAILTDGTVQETVKIPVASTKLNDPTNINVAAPTVITDVSVVINKASFATNAKTENITVVVTAKTVNGVVGITPAMVSELKSIAAQQAGTSAAKTNIDIKINSIAADGKAFSIIVCTEGLKNNAVVKAYARDPITGGYILLNIPTLKYNAKTGLVTNGLVSGLEYNYVSAKQAKEIENSIINSCKVSDTFKNPVSVNAGSAVYLSQAISPTFNYANARKIEYSVSGNQGIINPATGIYVLNSNAKKGTVNVTIKVTLTNGKTKTIKTKLKIN